MENRSAIDVRFPSFRPTPFRYRGKRKKPCPSLGQDFRPAVPPKLTHSAHSLRAHSMLHARRPDNGCGPRRPLLSACAVRSALTSPFTARFSAAIPPPAALFIGGPVSYSSCSLVSLVVLIIWSRPKIVNRRFAQTSGTSSRIPAL